ncbi:hypothetical protein FRB90_006500 [Tulasnella sp. 427]|nr:hypothetical protein FRB90_006500 [Tulasnella sp. 427]
MDSLDVGLVVIASALSTVAYGLSKAARPVADEIGTITRGVQKAEHFVVEECKKNAYVAEQFVVHEVRKDVYAVEQFAAKEAKVIGDWLHHFD